MLPANTYDDVTGHWPDELPVGRCSNYGQWINLCVKG